MSVYAKRLREARKRLGMSQELLGVSVGIEEASASARMNQYKKGKLEPIVEAIAKALRLPEAYHYAKEDELAKLIYLYNELNDNDKFLLILKAEELLQLPPN